MGGDLAPGPIVEGAVAAAREAGVAVLLVGVRDEIARELARAPDAGALDITLLDAPEVVGMGMPYIDVLGLTFLILSGLLSAIE